MMWATQMSSMRMVISWANDEPSYTTQFTKQGLECTNTVTGNCLDMLLPNIVTHVVPYGCEPSS